MWLIPVGLHLSRCPPSWWSRWHHLHDIASLTTSWCVHIREKAVFFHVNRRRLTAILKKNTLFLSIRMPVGLHPSHCPPSCWSSWQHLHDIASLTRSRCVRIREKVVFLCKSTSFNRNSHKEHFVSFYLHACCVTAFPYITKDIRYTQRRRKQTGLERLLGWTYDTLLTYSITRSSTYPWGRGILTKKSNFTLLNGLQLEVFISAHRGMFCLETLSIS